MKRFLVAVYIFLQMVTIAEAQKTSSANTHSFKILAQEISTEPASGKALQLLSRSPAAWVLKIDDYEPSQKDEYQVEAAWNKERSKLVFYICNRTNSSQQSSFDISDLAKQFTHASIHQLHADSPVAMNTLQQPDAIRSTVSNQKLAVRNQLYTVSSPAYSFTEIVLE